MGPSAFRAAGLMAALRELGYEVEDRGSITPGPLRVVTHPNKAGMPITCGGDHSLAAGTLSGLGRYAAAHERELFVLWLDAHPDFHTLDTTQSGNLHGVPVAYATGLPGFENTFPPLESPIKPQNICMMGIRSVDPAERIALAKAGVVVHDMRAIDELGIPRLLSAFLDRVHAADGLLHAPAVGTTVPGGATFREAHLVMEMLHDSGLVRSLDLVELNPFLDERGRTALLLVDLVASLMGRSVLDRPTRSF
jgi:arginase